MKESLKFATPSETFDALITLLTEAGKPEMPQEEKARLLAICRQWAVLLSAALTPHKSEIDAEIAAQHAEAHQLATIDSNEGMEGKTESEEQK